MNSTFRRGLALACLIATAALPAQTAAPLRVLFLGNSLTDGNDVPALVQAMAQLQGVRLEYTTVAPGGYAIEDHWRDRRQALLESGNYDVLVLQQGPSTLADSQANLREWAVAWANEARRFGTRPALYMIWPVRTQSGGFELVSQSYRNAAFASDAAIFPAGEAWQKALLANPALPLYMSDNLHAQPAGSFLAAMVIARGLVALDPARVPATVRNITLPAATLGVFRTIVSQQQPETLRGLDAGLPNPSPAPDASSAADPSVITRPATAEPAVTPTTPTAPAASLAAASDAGGGGGAPSLWFLFVLLTVGAVRGFRPRGFQP